MEFSLQDYSNELNKQIQAEYPLLSYREEQSDLFFGSFSELRDLDEDATRYVFSDILRFNSSIKFLNHNMIIKDTFDNKMIVFIKHLNQYNALQIGFDDEIRFLNFDSDCYIYCSDAAVFNKRLILVYHKIRELKKNEFQIQTEVCIKSLSTDSGMKDEFSDFNSLGQIVVLSQITLTKIEKVNKLREFLGSKYKDSFYISGEINNITKAESSSYKLMQTPIFFIESDDFYDCYLFFDDQIYKFSIEKMEPLNYTVHSFKLDLKLTENQNILYFCFCKNKKIVLGSDKEIVIYISNKMELDPIKIQLNLKSNGTESKKIFKDDILPWHLINDLTTSKIFINDMFGNAFDNKVYLKDGNRIYEIDTDDPPPELKNIVYYNISLSVANCKFYAVLKIKKDLDILLYKDRNSFSSFEKLLIRSVKYK